MRYVVYALSSISRNYLYIGLSSNLSNRIERHNKGYMISALGFSLISDLAGS